MRVSVAVGLACDGACVFCAQDGLSPEPVAEDVVRARLTAARAAGADAVTFVGGEPAIDPRLAGWVAAARAAGFARVGVQSNGVALAEPGRVAALADAGLTDLHLSIHGAEARVHDWHAGRPGAFDAALRTLAAARAAALEVVVVTLITRSTFRVLSAVPRLLAARGVGAWCLDVPRWRGRAATANDRVVPRLALALPFALHALDAARALGLRAMVRGAPACLLGPFAAHAIDGAGEVRSFAAPCEACPARPTCPGVDAEYLERYGAGELAARPAATRAATDGHWRDLFVGVGAMAAPPTASVHPTPARARVALPMLGRPAAAHAEVPSGAPKQSGEALRAILPGLFGSPGQGTPPDAKS